MPITDSELLAKTQEFGTLQDRIADAVTKRDSLITERALINEKVQTLTTRIQEWRARLTALRQELRDGA